MALHRRALTAPWTIGSAMHFLHPWALAVSVAAATLPVVIHWLTRPRPVRLPLSTIRFVQEALRQHRARHRLRDYLILALRTLAVLLLSWAVARPFLAAEGAVVPPEAGAVSRVVILDVSQSMAAESNGVQTFERARAVAARRLEEQTGLQAGLILAGSAARSPFERLSSNLAALREELAGARPRHERLNLQAALNLASSMLARAGEGQKQEVVIVSDLQRSQWVRADFKALPESAAIYLDAVAAPAPLDNVAIRRVAAAGRVEQGREARIEIDVANFGPAPRRLQVEVMLGESTQRVDGLCPSGGRITLAAPFTPKQPGWQAGEARLLGLRDALHADNHRPFVVEVRPPPTFGLLTRQPADVRPSSSYFLECALAPTVPTAASASQRILRLDPAQLDRERLASVDLVVIDHPGRLDSDVVGLLATLLRRGRGLLYVAADPVDAVNLRLLADALGSDWQLPVEFVPPAPGQRRRNLFLTEVRQETAPFRVFGERQAVVVGPLRFGGGLATRRLESGLADDVLATFSDRSAALCVSGCGAGVVAILNADLSQSNLPASSAFVPLMGELAERLLGLRRSQDDVACGEAFVAHLPPGTGPASSLALEPHRFSRLERPTPSGSELGQLVDEDGGVSWRSGGISVPGVVKVLKGEEVAFAVAMAVPPEESDLRTLEPSVFQDRLAGGRKLTHRNIHDQEDDQRDDLWTWLVIACVGCLLAELLALRHFRT